MVIRFNEIYIEGFMSIGTATVDLSDRGIVLVKGVNNFEDKSDSNGSGKSAIFEAILWTLTGVTARGSSNVVNKYTTTGCKCVLNLSVDGTVYEITRSKDHVEVGTSLRILKNDDDISANTVTKTKKVLESELPKLTYDTLTSIIIMSQGLPNRLSSLKPAQRKSRLEELSSAEYYLSELDTKMRTASTDLSQSRTEVMMEISKLSGILSSSESAIRSALAKIDQIQTESGTLISKDDADKYELKIKELGDTITGLNESSSQVRSRQSMINMNISNLSNQVANIKSDLSRLMSTYSTASAGRCPTCNQYITNPEEIEALKSKCLEDSVALKRTLSEYMNTLESDKSESANLSEKLTTIDQTISSLSQELNQLSQEVTRYNSFSNTTDYLNETIESNNKVIEDNKKIQEEYEKQKSSIESEISIHSYLKKVMSTKFRSFLLEGTVQYLNDRCKLYSSVLFSSQGKVNLEVKGNSIDIKLGDDTYFEELSGGESRKVDLILQLAQRDLARNESGLSSNILVMDEVLDYLDRAGINSVIELVESISSDVDSILVVSHKLDVPIPHDETITVIKDATRVSKIM